MAGRTKRMAIATIGTMTPVVVIRAKTAGQMATDRHREAVSEVASAVGVEVVDQTGERTESGNGATRVLIGQTEGVARAVLHDRRITVEILGSGVPPDTLKLNHQENRS